jgi:starch synthase (maltosyl-transferring)
VSLPTILQALEVRPPRRPRAILCASLWAHSGTQPDHTAAIQVNPYDFYYQLLAKIAIRAAQPLVQGAGGEWSRHAVVYGMFPRVMTAFDHNGDDQISIAPNSDGWRETGTLLKSMALLPYIREMGFNTVHLLPVTAIGRDGRKGTLGSPYAIRNPYLLDENLDEPALGLTAEQLFKGFVEAAHRLGMRVVVEFVLRTAAKDSD